MNLRRLIEDSLFDKAGFEIFVDAEVDKEEIDRWDCCIDETTDDGGGLSIVPMSQLPASTTANGVGSNKTGVLRSEDAMDT